ncbi:MAG: RNA polymerase subunit sigma-70, partial [Gemmatimonadales bacterium]
MASPPDTLQILRAGRAGEADAADELFARLYGELRRIARQRLIAHRPGDTLNTTALVHEAYVHLVDQTAADWQDRAHFLAVASRAMRFVLVDYARAR